jgi:hypothetical protein
MYRSGNAGQSTGRKALRAARKTCQVEGKINKGLAPCKTFLVIFPVPYAHLRSVSVYTELRSLRLQADFVTVKADEIPDETPVMISPPLRGKAHPDNLFVPLFSGSTSPNPR